MYIRDILDTKSLMENSTNNDDIHFAELERTGYWGKRGAGTLFFATETGRFCFALRSTLVEEPLTWAFWGGAIDPKEDPLEAVNREALEETGFDTRNYPSYLIYLYEDGSFKYYNFVTVVDKEFEPVLNWENRDFKWCEYDNFPEPLHFGAKIALSDPYTQRFLTELMREYS